MKIILMRHYKVAMHFQRLYTSECFDQAGLEYSHCDVINQMAPSLPQYRLYASTMKRAQQTAQLAFKRPFEILEGVHEVTIKSYKDTLKPLPLWWWELMGRIQWRFNHKRPYEPYQVTMDRLEGALSRVIANGDDAIIVMHGLVMRYMVKHLRARGFKGPRILHAKNGQCFIYERP